MGLDILGVLEIKSLTVCGHTYRNNQSTERTCVSVSVNQSETWVLHVDFYGMYVVLHELMCSSVGIESVVHVFVVSQGFHNRRL